MAIGISGTPRNLTANVAEQESPAVSGDVAVWVDHRTGNSDIWGCTVSADPASCAAPPVNLTQHAAEQIEPGISGNVVVWRDTRLGPTNHEIFGCNISGGLESCVATTQNATQATLAQFAPAISGTTLAWVDLRLSSFQIFGCDISGGLSGCGPSAVRLTPGTAPISNVAPRIAFGTTFVAWTSEIAPGDAEIYWCDISTGLSACQTGAVNLTQAASAQHSPAASGTVIVWNDHRLGLLGTPNIELFGCDVSDGPSTCATDPANLTQTADPPGLVSGAISGNVVVYAQAGIAACDIGASLGSCPGTSVPVNPAGAKPALSGTLVVWQGAGPGGDNDIFAVRLTSGGSGDNHPPTAVACAAVNVPPLPPPCLQTQTSVSGPIPRPVTLDGSGSSDPDNDALSYTWTEGSSGLGVGRILEVSLAAGAHSITLTVSDGHVSSTAEVTLTILREVVILVHGIFGSSLEDDGKNTFGDLERLLRPKFQVVAYDYSILTTLCATTTNPIERIAADFARWLHGENDFPAFRPAFPAGILGSRPINIVAHSMGGLVVSAYMTGLSDPAFASPPYQAGEFDRFVTLGTPYYGAEADDWRTLEKVVCKAAGLFSPSLKRGIQEEQMQLGSEFVWRLHSKWQQAQPLSSNLMLNVAGWAGLDDDGIVPMWSAVRPVEEGVTTSYAPCKHVESFLLAPRLACPLAFVTESSPAPMLGIISPFLNEGTVVGSALPPVPASNRGLLLVRSEKPVVSAQEFGEPFPGFKPIIEVTGPSGKFTCAPGQADCVYNTSTGALTILRRPAPARYTVTLKGPPPSGYQPVSRTLGVVLARGKPSVVRFQFTPQPVATTAAP